MSDFIIESKHPEKREGEIFLGNYNDEYYKVIGWKTKRKGIKPIYNHVTPQENSGIFPVFAKQQELIEAGIEIRAE